MPTNKLWLEHTEKAAWESVQALRDKIAEAERRIERLGPPVAAWQPLLDELDHARGELGLASEDYVDVLRALLERAAQDKRRIEELSHALEHARLLQQSEREQLARQKDQPVDVTALLRHPGQSYFEDDGDEDYDYDYEEAHPQRVSRITHDLERRRRELLAERSLPGDVDALMRLIDAKVADLGDVEGLALAEAALDLGVFATALAALHDDE